MTSSSGRIFFHHFPVCFSFMPPVLNDVGSKFYKFYFSSAFLPENNLVYLPVRICKNRIIGVMFFLLTFRSRITCAGRESRIRGRYSNSNLPDAFMSRYFIFFPCPLSYVNLLRRRLVSARESVFLLKKIILRCDNTK